MRTHISISKFYMRACLAIVLIQCSNAQFKFHYKSNATQLAAKLGFRAEEYSVTTEDGYILTMQRIPGRGRPVLLVHPLMDSSETWLLRGETSLGIALARQGLDVWMGNIRGNEYSRRHIYLDPDWEAEEFWKFSFHEHGCYDLPAFIDFVLHQTGYDKLNAIGMSQGTTMFFVMGSARPEYNDKVNAFIAMAPVAFLDHIPQPLLSIIRLALIFFPLREKLRSYEMFGNSRGATLLNSVCSDPLLGYFICGLGIVFPIVGFDVEEYGPAFHYKGMKRFPQSTSLRNFEHFIQVNQGRRFAWFDYGTSENVRVYGSEVPPDYDLGRVTMPVVLLCGRNDKLSLLADVAKLRKRLPNVVQYSVLARHQMNHLDFVWGQHMDRYLFPYVFRAINKYF